LANYKITKVKIKLGTNIMTTLSAKLRFYIPHAHSLKEKRVVVRGVVDKVKSKFNVAVAEVGEQDLHQTMVIGVAVVSGEYSHAARMLDEVIRFIEGNADAELVEVERCEH